MGGHDPTGGAGIQADIETVSALGGTALTLPTALTIQDSHRVHRFTPTPVDYLLEQGHLLLQEFPISAIKIGMVASVESAAAIARLLQPYGEIPVVLDPVLAAGGGGALHTEGVASALRQTLLPITTMATPNREELGRLVPEKTEEGARSQQLINLGTEAVLVTGTDQPASGEGEHICHTLYQDTRYTPFQSPRLPHHYHGSGCTLASAIATLIAQKIPLAEAIQTALDYTLETLRHASHPTSGQHFPNRYFPNRLTKNICWINSVE